MEKHLVNRGFMRGPFLPLYGSAGIMMLIVSRPFYDNVFLVYLAGVIGATTLEYVVGVVMEALFKVRYWDYSHKRFNFHGYISLESSLVWGVCTVVFSHYLQIPIERMIMAIPNNILTAVTLVLTVYVSCDFMVAFKTALDLRDVLLYLEKAKTEMQKMQKRLDVIIAFRGEDVMEGIGNRVDGLNNRFDVISSTLENTFSSIRERIKLDPSAYVESAKDEVGELYVKYRVILSKVTPSPVKNFFVWYRNRTIAGNPTMVSKFRSSMEDIKEKVLNR
jgi:uncharacterized membrane protein